MRCANSQRGRSMSGMDFAQLLEGVTMHTTEAGEPGARLQHLLDPHGLNIFEICRSCSKSMSSWSQILHG